MGVCCSRSGDNSVHALRPSEVETETAGAPNSQVGRQSKAKASGSRFDDRDEKDNSLRPTTEPTKARSSKSGKSTENSANAPGPESKGETLRAISIHTTGDSSPSPLQSNIKSPPLAGASGSPAGATLNPPTAQPSRSNSHGPKIQHAFTFSGPVEPQNSTPPNKSPNYLAVGMNVSNMTFQGPMSPTASMKKKKSRYLTEIPNAQKALRGLASPKNGNRRRKSEELKNPPVGGDGVVKLKRKHKRRTSHKGMMSRLALQFPHIRKSFMAVYSVFERYMMTKSFRKVNPRAKRGSTVEIKEMGNITQDKLGQVLEAITAVYGRKKFDEQEIKELFNIADLDGSKSISFREFLIAVALGYFLKYDFPDDTSFCEIQKGFKCVETAFKDMDDDGSNTVDANELKNALFSANSLQTNSAILEERFKELDINNDGDVSLPEFLFTLASWVGFWADDEDEPDKPMELAEQPAEDDDTIPQPIVPASPKNRAPQGILSHSPNRRSPNRSPQVASAKPPADPVAVDLPTSQPSDQAADVSTPIAGPIKRVNTDNRPADLNIEEL